MANRFARFAETAQPAPAANRFARFEQDALSRDLDAATRDQFGSDAEIDRLLTGTIGAGESGGTRDGRANAGVASIANAGPQIVATLVGERGAANGPGNERAIGTGNAVGNGLLDNADVPSERQRTVPLAREGGLEPSVRNFSGALDVPGVGEASAPAHPPRRLYPHRQPQSLNSRPIHHRRQSVTLMRCSEVAPLISHWVAGNG